MSPIAAMGINPTPATEVEPYNHAPGRLRMKPNEMLSERRTNTKALWTLFQSALALSWSWSLSPRDRSQTDSCRTNAGLPVAPVGGVNVVDVDDVVAV